MTTSLNHNRTTQLNDFFIDKERIKTYLQQQKENTTHSSLSESNLQHIKQITQRWHSFPIFTRSLAPYLEQLQQYTPSPLNALRPAANDTSTASPDTYQKPQLKLVSSTQLPPSPTVPPLHPTPSAIHDFYLSQSIIGEHTNQELLIYALLACQNIGIESLPGSGKSALLYATLNALPKESYHVIHQATAKSLYNNPNINNNTIWIIPELQKIFTPELEELIKNLTEGQTSTYTRTNNTKTGIDSFAIEKKTILYTFAITNKHLKHRGDEFYRRFIILHTDISKEKNRLIALHAAKLELSPKTTYNPKPFQHHLSTLLTTKTNIKNPYRTYLNQNFPQHILNCPQFPTAQNYLNNLIKGCTQFHTTNYTTSILFSSLSDVTHLLDIYTPTLITNLYNLNVIDNALLHFIPEKTPEQPFEQPPLTLNALKDQFYDHCTPKHPLEDSIKKLTQANLITSYPDQTIHRTIPLTITFNIEHALDSASENMKLHFPEHYEKWFTQQTPPTTTP